MASHRPPFNHAGLLCNPFRVSIYSDPVPQGGAALALGSGILPLQGRPIRLAGTIQGLRAAGVTGGRRGTESEAMVVHSGEGMHLTSGGLRTIL